MKNNGNIVYRSFCAISMAVLALLFTFPLYWILTGSLKDAKAINSRDVQWYPHEPTFENYIRLFEEPAFRWLLNTVVISVGAMLLTCLVASMGGYAIAKKRFVGKTVIFGLMVAAMALPKQVILIPLLKQMNVMGIHDTLASVMLPIVGWPFGVFLMKQFSEGIPTEMLEAARIDGAGEALTFVRIVFPMIKPGVGALAIFTFISSWNDYFMQLIMLNSREKLTISLGIAKLQAESATDFGMIMAGAALAAIPIIAVFITFQKYFTKGITMGAVKG